MNHLQFDDRELSILTQVVYKERCIRLRDAIKRQEDPEDVAKMIMENDEFIVEESLRLARCISKVRQKYHEGMSKLNNQ